MYKYGFIQSKNNKNNLAKIVITRPEACSICGGCSASNCTTVVSMPTDYPEGKWVRISFPSNQFILTSFLTYGIALIGFVLGLLVGNLFFPTQESMMALCSLIGLGIASFIIFRIDKVVKLSPVVDAVYDKNPEEE